MEEVDPVEAAVEEALDEVLDSADPVDEIERHQVTIVGYLPGAPL